jgi:hypothetical protein
MCDDQDVVARRPTPCEPALVENHRLRCQPSQPRSVDVDHEDPHRAVVLQPDEHESLPVRRVVTRDVAAAGVGRNPGQSAAVGDTDGVDPVPLRIVDAVALAREALPVRRPGETAMDLERGVRRRSLAEVLGVRSMKCAAIPSSQQKKEIVLPSGAQRALLAPRSNSSVTSLPSGFMV